MKTQDQRSTDVFFDVSWQLTGESMCRVPGPSDVHAAPVTPSLVPET